MPHDVRIAEAFGSIDVHTCSGPHVFQVTLENIPNIAATEAGFIESACAGCTSVDMAEKAIGDRPIILRIGQELPPGEEYGVIKKDIDRYQNNPRLLFSYSGMHWRKRDRQLIRDIHRSLDAYWADKFGNGS
ncbi:hypothetical protein HY605_02700 [Candidatus Peregrinibacteria bacterium]|nr:hypothetical protein [Candidatus Peregrinibacteria bacterium]